MFEHDDRAADLFSSSEGSESSLPGLPEMPPMTTHAPTPRAPRVMPDIAKKTAPHIRGPLDRVGMGHIEMPVLVDGGDGRVHAVPAVCDAFVSLDDVDAKGIHMSRLFLGLQQTLEDETLSAATLVRVLDRFIASHAGLSARAHVSARFELLRKRQALVSQERGWRSYPVKLFATREADGTTRVGLEVRVTYSSTCPCSAALARQLIQEQFDTDFGGQAHVDAATVRAWLGTPEAIRATPHSQRSHADVTVTLADPLDALNPDALIGAVEAALQTVVQAAVKREDEQAFALLNGQNLMFCEDAARRVRAALEADARIADWRVVASHHESLHPHDAVAIAVKGVAGGLQP
jgi:GTP cyclohydrolase I